MPHIFISHARQDRALAAIIASALEAQGLSVWYDQDPAKPENSPRQIAGRIREAAAVIAIWTRTSAASRQVQQEAALAHDLGKLISLRMPGLEVSQLPAGIRNADVLLLTGRDEFFNLLRKKGLPLDPAAIAKEAGAEWPGDELEEAAHAEAEASAKDAAPPPAEAAAPSPAPAQAPAAPASVKREAEAAPAEPYMEAAERRRASAQAGSQAGSHVKAGKLVENVPQVMRTGIPAIAEVRISRKDTDALLAGLQGEVHKHDIVTTPAMTVTLQAPEGGFAIQNLSRDTQWIDGSYIAKLGLLGQADYGCWKWIVTPLESGTKRLNIVAAAKSSEAGLQAETPLPEQVVQVKVRVNYSRAARQFVKWIAVAAAGGVVAEYANTVIKLAAPLIQG